MGVIKGIKEVTISKLTHFTNGGKWGRRRKRKEREFQLKDTETTVNYLSGTLCSLKGGVYKEIGLQK